MAAVNPQVIVSGFSASADLSSSQHCAVAINGANNTVALPSAGARIFAVLNNAPESGEAAELVMQGGIVKVKTGAAYSAGADLMVNASGEFITATSTNEIVAVALEASGGASEYHRVILTNGGTAA